MDFKSNDVAMAERGSGLKHAARIGTGREVPVEVIVNGVSRRTSFRIRHPSFNQPDSFRRRMRDDFLTNSAHRPDTRAA